MARPRCWMGLCRVDLLIPGASSLKDRRSVVRSLLEQCRRRFNLSAAELGPDGSHQEASLAFSLVASCSSEAQGRMAALESFLLRGEEVGPFEILHREQEVWCDDDFSPGTTES